jgi:cell division protein FtsB
VRAYGLISRLFERANALTSANVDILHKHHPCVQAERAKSAKLQQRIDQLEQQVQTLSSGALAFES